MRGHGDAGTGGHGDAGTRRFRIYKPTTMSVRRVPVSRPRLPLSDFPHALRSNRR